jgi:threonine/homoserine/homoserine lactone efflux protein
MLQVGRELMYGFQFLLRGLVIGFSIAAPVGPIGVLCIRRTLAEGWVRGLVSGLGAAGADAIYGCVAGFGITFVSSFLIEQQLWLRLVGGVFLCFLGVRIFLSTPSEQVVPAKTMGLFSAFASTFFLTLSNPVTILSFAAIFAGLGLGSTGESYAPAAILVFGVFVGSALWWLVLSGSVSVFRRSFTAAKLRWVNRISGIVIVGFGASAVLSLIL